MDVCFYNTKIGRIGLVAGINRCSKIHINDSVMEEFYRSNPDKYYYADEPIVEVAFWEIDMHFDFGHEISVNFFHARGSKFQHQVWDAISQIPYGETRSYNEIAEQIGCPEELRKVMKICHKNPLPIVVPCHRVIGYDGDLTDYVYGIEVKKTLLKFEQDLMKTVKYKSHQKEVLQWKSQQHL